jgi:WD40 repeat protein
MVNTVVFNKESSTIASGSSDGTVKVWDASTGSCQHTLERHT